MVAETGAISGGCGKKVRPCEVKVNFFLLLQPDVAWCKAKVKLTHLVAVSFLRLPMG